MVAIFASPFLLFLSTRSTSFCQECILRFNVFTLIHKAMSGFMNFEEKEIAWKIGIKTIYDTCC